MKFVCCERCKGKYPSCDIINLVTEGKYEKVCCDCFSEDSARDLGLFFEKLKEKVAYKKGKDGRNHKFYITRRILGNGIFLSAIEDVNDDVSGYDISIHGELDCDQGELLNKLNKKIEKLLSKKYISLAENGHISLENNEAVGRILCDEDFAIQQPRLIIDGREYSWFEFGKMLMTYEGFQFKLQILDPYDDID